MSGKRIKIRRRNAKRLYDAIVCGKAHGFFRRIDAFIMGWLYGKKIKGTFKRFFQRVKRSADK